MAQMHALIMPSNTTLLKRALDLEQNRDELLQDDMVHKIAIHKSHL